MAAKKGKSSSSKDSPGSLIKAKTFFIISLAILALFILGGAIYAAFQVPGVLMTKNKRFTLKHIEVNSNGSWNGKGEKLGEKINIKPDSNLFELDLRKIKNDIKKADKGITHCEVEVVLPDTLKITIKESVPRAVLNRRPPGTPDDHIWVVDETGKSFCRDRDGVPEKSLPKINGYSPEDSEKQLQTAMHLVMTAMKDYPDIKINSISVKEKEYLTVHITYREQVSCTALFPVKEEQVKEYRFLLNTLQSMILQANADKKMFRICDLRFEGRPTTRY